MKQRELKENYFDKAGQLLFYIYFFCTLRDVPYCPPPPKQKINISEWAEGELRGKTAKTWFLMVLGGGKVKQKLTQLISEWAEGELRGKKLRLWDQKNM
jgi:hypothetical protein